MADLYDNNYKVAITSGSKPAFKLDEIEEIEHPKIGECGYNQLKSFVKKIGDILEFFPNRLELKKCMIN
jgi:hypothetical protein